MDNSRVGVLDKAAMVLNALEAGPQAHPVVHWTIEQAIADVRTVAPTRVEHVSVWLPVPASAILSNATRHAVTVRSEEHTSELQSH